MTYDEFWSDDSDNSPAMRAYHAATSGKDEIEKAFRIVWEASQLSAAAAAVEPDAQNVLIEGTWPADDIRRAFVSGARWWEYHKEGATMWQSDRNEAEAEADKRYPNGAPAQARANAAVVEAAQAWADNLQSRPAIGDSMFFRWDEFDEQLASAVDALTAAPRPDRESKG